LRDVLFGGEQAFQVLGIAVADVNLAGGVLLGKVRVEPLIAIASELACVRRPVGGEVEGVR
jgi:small neutral amino acid transporter SnatA (MarC family)